MPNLSFKVASRYKSTLSFIGVFLLLSLLISQISSCDKIKNGLKSIAQTTESDTVKSSNNETTGTTAQGQDAGDPSDNAQSDTGGGDTKSDTADSGSSGDTSGTTGSGDSGSSSGTSGSGSTSSGNDSGSGSGSTTSGSGTGSGSTSGSTGSGTGSGNQTTPPDEKSFDYLGCAEMALAADEVAMNKAECLNMTPATLYTITVTETGGGGLASPTIVVIDKNDVINTEQAWCKNLYYGPERITYIKCSFVAPSADAHVYLAGGDSPYQIPASVTFTIETGGYQIQNESNLNVSDGAYSAGMVAVSDAKGKDTGSIYKFLSDVDWDAIKNGTAPVLNTRVVLYPGDELQKVRMLVISDDKTGSYPPKSCDVSWTTLPGTQKQAMVCDLGYYEYGTLTVEVLPRGLLTDYNESIFLGTIVNGGTAYSIDVETYVPATP